MPCNSDYNCIPLASIKLHMEQNKVTLETITRHTAPTDTVDKGEPLIRDTPAIKDTKRSPVYNVLDPSVAYIWRFHCMTEVAPYVLRHNL